MFKIFEESLQTFVRSYFEPVADSLLTQREYLQHCVKFPVNGDVKFKEFIDQLFAVNNKLVEFPSPSRFSRTNFFRREN